MRHAPTNQPVSGTATTAPSPTGSGPATGSHGSSSLTADGGGDRQAPAAFLTRHRVLRALGPLLVALAVLLALFLSPLAEATHYSKAQLDSFARDPWSRSNFIGYAAKQQAFSQPEYLPILGSSEMEHMDSFHPNVFFDKYQLGYTPYLIGQKGTQSLPLFFYLNSVASQLRNRKLVFIISPQWFSPAGINPTALGDFVSKGEVYSWLNTATPATPATRQLANRLLTIPNFSDDYLIKTCLQAFSQGHPLNPWQRTGVYVSDLIWKKEDLLFAPAHDRRTIEKGVKRVRDYGRHLPAQPNPKALDELAIRQGRALSDNNPYNISNGIWAKSHKALLAQKGKMTAVSYQQSPEYADFQQVLSQLAANNDQVLFVIQPVNGVYERKLTGLPLRTLQRFSAKITYQLRQQGFKDILDLTDKYNEPYYSGDTIHFGTRGWLATDLAIINFMKKPFRTGYRLDSKFLSTKWQAAPSAADFEQVWRASHPAPLGTAVASARKHGK